MVVAKRVRLTYPVELLRQPVLYQLIRQFELVTNIMQADVSPQSGCIILEMRGEEETIQKALDWMAEQGIQVHVLTKDEEITCRL